MLRKVNIFFGLKHQACSENFLMGMDCRYERWSFTMYGKICCCYNKYMDNYDKNKVDCYLVDFDVNNLYGYALMQSVSSQLKMIGRIPPEIRAD